MPRRSAATKATVAISKQQRSDTDGDASLSEDDLPKKPKAKSKVASKGKGKPPSTAVSRSLKRTRTSDPQPIPPKRQKFTGPASSRARNPISDTYDTLMYKPEPFTGNIPSPLPMTIAPPVPATPPLLDIWDLKALRVTGNLVWVLLNENNACPETVGNIQDVQRILSWWPARVSIAAKPLHFAFYS